MKMKKILTIGVLLGIAYYFRAQILIGVMAIYWVVLPNAVPPSNEQNNGLESYEKATDEQIIGKVYSDTIPTDTLYLK